MGRAEPYLKGSFVPNAKRTPKTAHLRRGTQPDTLRRNLSDPSVLQKNEAEVVASKESSLPPTIQRVPSSRAYLGHHLRDYRWGASLEQNKDIARQWCLPTNHRTGALSVLEQPAAIFKTHRCQDHSRRHPGPRSSAAEDVLSAEAAHEPHPGFRFHSADHLRQADRRSQGWLQSAQAGSAQLPSASLLRVQHQGFLAWGSATRECVHLGRRSGVFTSLSGEDTACHLPSAGKSRLWVFRSGIHRTSRREKNRLCHRSQDDYDDQEKGRWASVSSVQRRMASSGVLLHPLAMEGTSPVCSDSPTAAAKGDRAVDSFCHEAMGLSGFCDQLALGPREHLVFLSRPGCDRNTHQRTEGKLCIGQDSYEQFSCQPSVLLPASIGLRHRQLVSTDMLAGVFSKCYTSNNTDGISCIACTADKIRQQECAAIAGRVCDTGDHGENSEKN